MLQAGIVAYLLQSHRFRSANKYKKTIDNLLAWIIKGNQKAKKQATQLLQGIMMSQSIFLKSMFSTCATIAMLPTVLSPLAVAQTATTDEVVETTKMETVTITSSRIKRSVASTPSPITSITPEVFSDRGYSTASDLLNDLTALAPQLNQADGSGDASGSGQQYPDIFGLGAGRTLTLVNNRRFVTTSSGLGESQVDANIIPTGLIKRVDVVQAGGAAVYGSDAIAGVVNYILKDDYDGLELDLQYGDTEQGNYEQTSYRLTAGKNFDDNRGNIAINIEGSTSPIARFSDFDASNRSRITLANPLDTGPNDGIPSVAEILPAYFWNFNGNGVVYNTPAPLTFFQTNIDGSPIQFGSDGGLTSYDPGNVVGIPFAEGGQGTRYSDLVGLRTGVDRITANLIGHYDIASNIRLNGEFLYSKTDAESIGQGYVRSVLNQADPFYGAIPFFATNAFLTDENVADLSAANPAFGFGAPMWLSRHFYDDLAPSNLTKNETNTARLMLGLEGDFDAGDRNFYWEISGSYAEVSGSEKAWGVDFAKFNKAINAVDDGTGTAVCSVNADSDSTNDDASCVALNPFGAGNISSAASQYVSVMTGNTYENEQMGLLATIGTQIIDLPAGPIDAVLAYEHRHEHARYTPLEANLLGLVDTGTPQEATSGSYGTNEFSIETLVPIVSPEMSIPGIHALELDGTYRYVENSIAGKESVWSAGLRWEILDGITARATKSRNFRAPSLEQLFAPTSVALSSIGNDPCDSDNINAGPNPALRRANCEAEWAANPQYANLDTFQDYSENFTYASITSGGNAELQNEVSDTTTYGIVFDNFLVSGLSLSVDRIEIDLEDGLSAFTTEDFMAACYDSVGQTADVCSAFTRLQASTDPTIQAGSVISGRTTTFNAGQVVFRGEVYYANYSFDLTDIAKSLSGEFSFGVEATHVSDYSTSVTGTTFVSTDGTVDQPDWSARIDAGYVNGPFRATYKMSYLDSVLAEEGATIENNPNHFISSNYTHDLSAAYELQNGLTVRAGVKNMFDEAPSYPSLSYGDILGRRYFVGLNYMF